jgi:hypothetical protein
MEVSWTHSAFYVNVGQHWFVPLQALHVQSQILFHVISLNRFSQINELGSIVTAAAFNNKPST